TAAFGRSQDERCRCSCAESAARQDRGSGGADRGAGRKAFRCHALCPRTGALCGAVGGTGGVASGQGRGRGTLACPGNGTRGSGTGGGGLNGGSREHSTGADVYY